MFWIQSVSTVHIFSWFNECIQPQVRDSQSQGIQFWCQQKPLVTSVICYMFQKTLFEVWFYTIVFLILYVYIARGRGWQPLGDEILMSTGTSCHFGHLLQVWEKISFNPSRAAIKISINATAAEFICKNIFLTSAQVKKIIKNKIGDIQQIYLYQNVCK